ncbi:recombinase family protein [Bradyrhizobium sp. 159]|uniref:recombinase family protein n=1 Tax=Bradyrhizobium sp. 159 TaxID=2782632 RepID=UPI001FF75212|nr:recombinase family protein [Bradyrhizobium sp. 159]
MPRGPFHIWGQGHSGITSVRGIAEELNRQGIHSPRGGSWHPTAVARLLNRLPQVA